MPPQSVCLETGQGRHAAGLTVRCGALKTSCSILSCSSELRPSRLPRIAWRKALLREHRMGHRPLREHRVSRRLLRELHLLSPPLNVPSPFRTATARRRFPESRESKTFTRTIATCRAPNNESPPLAGDAKANHSFTAQTPLDDTAAAEHGLNTSFSRCSHRR